MSIDVLGGVLAAINSSDLEGGRGRNTSPARSAWTTRISYVTDPARLAVAYADGTPRRSAWPIRMPIADQKTGAIEPLFARPHLPAATRRSRAAPAWRAPPAT